MPLQKVDGTALAAAVTQEGQKSHLFLHYRGYLQTPERYWKHIGKIREVFAFKEEVRKKAEVRKICSVCFLLLLTMLLFVVLLLLLLFL